MIADCAGATVFPRANPRHPNAIAHWLRYMIVTPDLHRAPPIATTPHVEEG